MLTKDLKMVQTQNNVVIRLYLQHMSLKVLTLRDVINEGPQMSKCK